MKTTSLVNKINEAFVNSNDPIKGTLNEERLIVEMLGNSPGDNPDGNDPEDTVTETYYDKDGKEIKELKDGMDVYDKKGVKVEGILEPETKLKP